MAHKKSESTPTDWEKTIATVNALMQTLKRKPRRLKLEYSLCPGGILNAYREGDLTFKQAVKALERWKNLERKKVSTTRRSTGEGINPRLSGLDHR